MVIDSLLPLYKILCIAIILLVPLMPAWLLYRMAPQDKILARGDFKGFKINATGAIAIFIVLFAAIYSNINGIAKSIDKIGENDKKIAELRDSVKTLQINKPWLLKFQIQLIDTDGKDAPDSVYRKCLDPYAVHASPMPLDISTSTKIISFYYDDEVLNLCKTNYSISFPGEYGTQPLPIPDSLLKGNEKKLIVLNARFIKNSSTGYDPGSKTRNVGRVTPPVVVNQ
jgi:hypothetical protein